MKWSLVDSLGRFVPPACRLFFSFFSIFCFLCWLCICWKHRTTTTHGAEVVIFLCLLLYNIIHIIADERESSLLLVVFPSNSGRVFASCFVSSYFLVRFYFYYIFEERKLYSINMRAVNSWDGEHKKRAKKKAKLISFWRCWAFANFLISFWRSWNRFVASLTSHFQRRKYVCCTRVREGKTRQDFFYYSQADCNEVVKEVIRKFHHENGLNLIIFHQNKVNSSSRLCVECGQSDPSSFLIQFFDCVQVVGGSQAQHLDCMWSVMGMKEEESQVQLITRHHHFPVEWISDKASKKLLNYVAGQQKGWTYLVFIFMVKNCRISSGFNEHEVEWEKKCESRKLLKHFLNHCGSSHTIQLSRLRPTSSIVDTFEACTSFSTTEKKFFHHRFRIYISTTTTVAIFDWKIAAQDVRKTGNPLMSRQILQSRTRSFRLSTPNRRKSERKRWGFTWFVCCCWCRMCVGNNDKTCKHHHRDSTWKECVLVGHNTGRQSWRITNPLPMANVVTMEKI